MDSTLLTGLVDSNCPLCDSSNSTAERNIAGYEMEKCGDCGLVFMNPRCTPDHLEEIYTVRDVDSLIDLYEKIASDTVIEVYNEKLDKLEKLLPTKGKLLDYACAAGYFYEKALERGWDASGYDIGLWAAAAAEKRGLPNMYVGKSVHEHFPDNHFDVVYAAQVFEHLLKPGETLNDLLRVLKPGGILYIDAPNYNTLPIRFNKDDFMLNEPPQHINYFGPTSLKKLLTDANMQNIEIYTEGGLKWENLVGRKINSDIAEAYGLADQNDAGESQTKESTISRVKTMAKEATKAALIKPLLYDSMKVGINIASISYKPNA